MCCVYDITVLRPVNELNVSSLSYSIASDELSSEMHITEG